MEKFLSSKEYHIRYTCSGEPQAQIVDFIMRNAQKYIISREVASREHIQCYVVSNIVKKTWVNKFNLKFTSMDRRDKYVELDKGNTKLYVCKGESISSPPDVIAKLGFSDEEITAFHSQYWQQHIPQGIQNICIDLPETETKKTKKPPRPTFMKEVRQTLIDEYPDREWKKSDKPIVFKKVMYMLGQSVRNLDHIILSRMTYGVLNSLIMTNQEWLEYWYNKAFGEELNPYADSEDIFTDSKYLY